MPAHSWQPSKPKHMRFLIVPNFPNPYDQRMVDGLAAGLRQLGHEARSLPSPLLESEAALISRELDLDVLLQVNRFRPLRTPLPPNVRHIAWFQDVFPDTLGDIQSQCRPGDIVYALGDPHVLGLSAKLPCYLGTLLTGVDGNITRNASDREQRNDFSLCGYIPPPLESKPNLRQDILWYLRDSLRRIPVFGTSLPMRGFSRLFLRRYQRPGYVPYAIVATFRNTVETIYQPLRGDLDIHRLATAMNHSIAPVLAHSRRLRRRERKKLAISGRLGFILSPYSSIKISTSLQPEIESLIGYFAREHPRLLDRKMLVTAALKVSRSIELYGDGWKLHPEFSPFHRGMISVQRELLEVYRTSRINLMNNTHGLGLHSRTLECMAVGGFIFTHRSPHDNKAGGMETSFDADSHYGVYAPETFEEDARRWLADEPGRLRAGRTAAEIVSQKHLWRHRAQQILDDLHR